MLSKLKKINIKFTVYKFLICISLVFLISVLAINDMPIYLKENSDLISSYKRYQYPFVGSHWIPHMSIASLKTKKNHSLIYNFLNETENFQMKVTEVSCWSIKKDQHQKIQNFRLI